MAPSPKRLAHERAPARAHTGLVRAMRLAGLFSLAIAVLAVTLLAKGGDRFHIHLLIATALGAGFGVMLVAALTLVFRNTMAAGKGRQADKKESE